LATRLNRLKPGPRAADLNRMSWTEFAVYLTVVAAVFGPSVSFVFYRLWWR
jgi:hypothetical protein